MAITVKPGNMPHISWIDLKNNGVLTECAIMKVDDFGNIYYFEVNNLDNIDKKRLVRIITNRNATNFELWDLMSQITLNNGVNALDYFHQLVKVISPEGVIYSPKSGVVGGAGTGTIDTNNPAALKEAEHRQAVAAQVSGETPPPQQATAPQQTVPKKKAPPAPKATKTKK